MERAENTASQGASKFQQIFDDLYSDSPARKKSTWTLRPPPLVPLVSNPHEWLFIGSIRIRDDIGSLHH